MGIYIYMNFQLSAVFLQRNFSNIFLNTQLLAARKVFLEMNDKTGQLKLQFEGYLFSQILIPITEAAITQSDQNRLQKSIMMKSLYILKNYI